MLNIDNIMKYLDWNNDEELKIEGIKLAINIKDVECFIQPNTQNYNKNVWESCALILYSKKDGELEPYIEKILEWLQDPNWPGFDIIFKRLTLMDANKLKDVYLKCIEKAKEQKDIIWLDMLSGLIKNENLYKLLPIKEKELLRSYYKNYFEKTISGNLGAVTFVINDRAKEDARIKLIEYILNNSSRVSFNIKNHNCNIRNIREKLIKKDKQLENRFLYFFKDNNCICETGNYFESGMIYIENIIQYEQIGKMGVNLSYYLIDKDSVNDFIKRDVK